MIGYKGSATFWHVETLDVHWSNPERNFSNYLIFLCYFCHSKVIFAYLRGIRLFCPIYQGICPYMIIQVFQMRFIKELPVDNRDWMLVSFIIVFVHIWLSRSSAESLGIVWQFQDFCRSQAIFAIARLFSHTWLGIDCLTVNFHRICPRLVILPRELCDLLWSTSPLWHDTSDFAYLLDFPLCLSTKGHPGAKKCNNL